MKNESVLGNKHAAPVPRRASFPGDKVSRLCADTLYSQEQQLPTLHISEQQEGQWLYCLQVLERNLTCELLARNGALVQNKGHT